MPSTSTFTINETPSESTLETPPGSDPEKDLTPLVYPENLLSEKTDLPSQAKTVPFIGFFVFVPVSAKVAKDESASFTEEGTQLLTQQRGLDYADEVNKKIDIGQLATDLATGKERIRIFRQVRALKKFICLYMPETLNSDLNASYAGGSFLGEKAQIAGSLVDAVRHGFKGDLMNQAQNILTNLIAAIPANNELVQGIKDTARFVQAGQGTAVNPLTEVFFENMTMRQFNFDFKFVPKTAKEASTLREIIQTFRMYMVPEINKDHAAGLFFSVPAFFQIKYLLQSGGEIHDNEMIPKISGCVLTNLTSDMAPDGIALHKDGSPVAIRLNMSFQELEIMHRDRIKEGY